MPAKKISRTWINFWLDCGLLCLFTALCWCAVVVQFVFPPAPDASGWTLWGWDYTQWSSLQFGLLAAFALSVLVHVMLHWSWVCGVLASRLGRRGEDGGKPHWDDGIRTLLGVATLIGVLHVIGIGVAIAVLTIQAPS